MKTTKAEFVLAIDQGTTGTTASLINLKTLEFVGKVNKEFAQIFPSPGRVEHNLGDILQSTRLAIEELFKKYQVPPHDLACIGLTNQRETIAAFDKKGNPLANAIVWQDRRTSDFCHELKQSQHKDDIQNKTGLAIDPYFSASKLKWLLENNQQVQQAAKKNDLLFGTMDTFLLYRLSGGESYHTEGSNASRTMLYDIEKGAWCDGLLQLFGIEKKCLPTVCDSFGQFGKTKGFAPLPDGLPITGILGDQQAALFGQGAVEKGQMKCTYGTGSFLLLNTGQERVKAHSGLLSTVAYGHKGKNHFAIEGSCYIAGAAVQWLRDQLGLVETSPEIENLARQVESLAEMEFLTFLPFFTGIGSPHWRPQAKGAIVGLTRGTSRAHLARACLDGVALSVNDLVACCQQNLSVALSSLRVDGGMAKNDLFCQIQANVSSLTIERPQVVETTSYGACLAAAMGIGATTFGEIQKGLGVEKEFRPDHDREFYQKKKQQWADTIKRLYL